MQQRIKEIINRFNDKHPEWWKYIKFTAMGLLGGVSEMSSYYLLVFVVLRNAPPDPFTFLGTVYASKALFYAFLGSAALGYAVGFILNRKHTFHADANPILSIALYIIMVILVIVVSSWIGITFAQWCAAHGYKDLGLALGKPIGGALSGIWTYPINRFLIHRKKKK